MPLASNRKRILIVDNGAIAVDGDGRCFMNSSTGEFACAIRRSGYDPVFTGPPEDYDANTNLYNFCLQDRNLESRLLEWHPKYHAPISTTKLLLEILNSYFVYIFFPGTLGRLAGLLCPLVGRPYGLYVRGSGFAQTGFDRRVLSKAAFALTVTPLLRKRIEPFCSATDIIRPMVAMTCEDAFDRPALAAAPAQWEFLFVGRLQVEKGVLELLETAEELRLRGLPFRLRLVGGGPLFHKLSERMRNDPLGANVEVLGTVTDKNDLMRLYREAHIFLFPSFYPEGSHASFTRR